MEVNQTWTAEHLRNGWAIVYDRTPNGEKNEDGSVSYALRLPVLLMSDWLADPEDTAKDVARELNAFPDLIEALRQCASEIGEWSRPKASNGMTGVGSDHPMMKAQAKAYEAIAKAESRS